MSFFRNPFKVFFLFLFFTSGLFLISAGAPYAENSLVNLYQVVAKMFEEKLTPEQLRQEYKSGKIKILIVPGHDNVSIGGQFLNIKETDLTIELAWHLFDFFKKDEKFETFITRERDGNYAAWFSGYVSQNKEAIRVFRDYHKGINSLAIEEGVFERNMGVFHNPAADNVSLNLYAINKWANDNDIDIVIHVHLNDYPTRQKKYSGKYTGFAIYVPEEQLPNSEASMALAKTIKSRLEKISAVSNFPGEKNGVVEEQELIAIGSNASRKGVSLLMEYGYLYESQFVNLEPRSVFLKELAAQTYLGTKDYFGSEVNFETTLLPYKWANNLQKDMKGLKDIVHLQAALLKEGFYPPSGKTLSDCPINGNFGDCTFLAVKEFQNKYEIVPTGLVGPKTLEKLNELYSLNK